MRVLHLACWDINRLLKSFRVVNLSYHNSHGIAVSRERTVTAIGSQGSIPTLQSHHRETYWLTDQCQASTQRADIMWKDYLMHNFSEILFQNRQSYKPITLCSLSFNQVILHFFPPFSLQGKLEVQAFPWSESPRRTSTLEALAESTPVEFTFVIVIYKLGLPV